jgi:hypothetical protein
VKVPIDRDGCTDARRRFRREAEDFALRCTCDWCSAFDVALARCVYGFPTEPHRHLPVLADEEFVFCKAFELT